MKKFFVYFVFCILALCLSACSPFVNGDIVIAKENIFIWQCPGGEGADNGVNKALNCIAQNNYGFITAGREMTVTKNSNGETEKFGYTRVQILNPKAINPINGEVFTLKGYVIGWVESSKIKLGPP